jgi:hypothetical protein
MCGFHKRVSAVLLSLCLPSVGFVGLAPRRSRANKKTARKTSCVLFSCLIATILGATSTVFGGPLTTVSYVETNCDFTWRFEWDEVSPPTSQLAVFSNKWDLFAETNDQDLDGFPDVGIDAQHRAITAADRCHPTDAFAGGQYNVALLAGGPAPTYPVAVAPLLLDMLAVEHISAPVNHSDIYNLTYTRAAVAANIIFELTGVHSDAIPEPATALLLAAGGLALLRRRRA